MTKKTNKSTSKDINQTIQLHRDLKASSYDSSINRIRKSLPSSNQRAFSSLIHGHGMDSLNDLVANILVRPKSILAGSILTLVVVTITAYLARSYGYSYNYLLLFLFFIVGYVIGLLLELIFSLFKKHR